MVVFVLYSPITLFSIRNTYCRHFRAGGTDEVGSLEISEVSYVCYSKIVIKYLFLSIRI